ncbi:M23 family metallopeptidase [Geodermatophilus sp. SYSU D00684]
MPARPLPVLLLACAALLVPAPAVAEPAAPAVPVVAVWTAPLGGPPVVTRPFAPPPSPYGPGHRGADLAGAPGDVVVAAGDGVVVFAGRVADRPVVSVDHADGLRTTYEPVDPAVAAGQRVARGSRLGTLAAGHAGCPAAACLHWGLRRGEVYLDPLSLLRPPRVRLLPLG